MKYTGSDIKRFESQIIKTKSCWTFKSYNHGGYHAFTAGGIRHLAHRWYWQQLNNRVLTPKELVLHKCDNKKCVNPKHLYVGSTRDNAIDAIKRLKPTRYCGVQHCKAKLTVAKVLKLRKLYGKYNYIELASLFNVHKNTIRAAVVGITWNRAIKEYYESK